MPLNRQLGKGKFQRLIVRKFHQAQMMYSSDLQPIPRNGRHAPPHNLVR